MPWKNVSVVAERERLIEAVRRKGSNVAQVCREMGVSRKTAYKWLARHHQEGCRGLSDRCRRPVTQESEQARRWRPLVLQLRRTHPHWGGKKIRACLAVSARKRRLPCARSIERWLKEQGLLRPRRYKRRGPGVPHPGLTVPRRTHQVWTVDFKGSYRTGDGQRQHPLTVRELYSRYVLAIRLLADQSDRAVRAVFARLFRAQGLPQAIRVDNGAPFGGKGPLGLTRLSVWWWRLGIRVEFTRRARPGDNAGHEQMHGLFAREVAATPAADRAREQRRADRWRQEYNERRPHEALAQRTPWQAYRPNARRYPPAPPPLCFPAGCSHRRVRAHGDIKWQGALRYIGRAFVGQKVGVLPASPSHHSIYWGKLLIGELHAPDCLVMRPANWRRMPQRAPKVLPMSCR